MLRQTAGCRCPWRGSLEQSPQPLSLFSQLSSASSSSSDALKVHAGMTDKMTIPSSLDILITPFRAFNAQAFFRAALKSQKWFLFVSGAYSLVCLELSVPVQVISRKDSSLKCVKRDVKLLTCSLTYRMRDHITARNISLRRLNVDK